MSTLLHVTYKSDLKRGGVKYKNDSCQSAESTFELVGFSSYCNLVNLEVKSDDLEVENDF